MLAPRIGPYFHPEGRHEHPYWVRAYLQRDNVFLVSKEAGLDSSEYDVDLNQKVMGRICQCEHHGNRRVPCHHMKYAKDAAETYNLWRKIGWVKEE